MIIRVLGCSGAIAAGCRTTSFLLGSDVLIDAGTGVGDNAPAGSSAPDAQGGGDGTQTGNPAGAMNYPATGTQ